MRLWKSRVETEHDKDVNQHAAHGEQLLSNLLALAWVIDSRDPFSGGRLWRVSRYCALLCEGIGLPIEQSASITLAGFVHDLGKIAMPDSALRKDGPLNAQDLAVIKTHPDVGARLMSGHPLSPLVLDAVHLHHEAPDGSGYPKGLKGDDIPLVARIVGLCDAFDGMTSARPGRKVRCIDSALDDIGLGLGSRFDAELGQRFVELGQEGLLGHIAGYSDDGIPLQFCLACGPTLVTRREQGLGDSVFCGNCGRHYVLETGHAEALLEAVPTGMVGTAQNLSPRPDAALIRRFVEDTARHALADLS
ncbi:HD domain-containing protein [Ralstonia pickettii]|uniref:HD-GYP domain-containing protein n=3 Tax=Burkholderiaceae TaxID=119060 RepID=A0ABN9IVL6_9RALS|nr:HD domain-containing protein [Ralstonia pickettii]CAJ0794340.1 hypothetical protein LMG18095_02589 [Ralstonia sp. LMG 18095]MBA9852315.1 HD domain-containing protein [Ralstonia pickettii]MBA9878713.1 HD domain-containing protein [Ralstonia pickettii]MBA9881946.1 HD domain-containing protein [Ralstonia pickettii]